MDKNLYRALVFWQDAFDKEHREVERLKKELEEKNKRIAVIEDMLKELRGDVK
jgi:hypothetical protein